MNKKRRNRLILLTLTILILISAILFKESIFKFLYKNIIAENLSFFNIENKSVPKLIKNLFKINAFSCIVSFFGIKNINSLKFIMALFEYVFLLAALKTYKCFFMQSQELIRHEKISIIKSGILCCGIFTLIILIFIFSVVGYGAAIIFIIIFMFFVIIGKAAICIYIGNKLTNKKNIFLNMLLGMTVTNVFYFIPYLDVIVFNILLPILSLGIMFQNCYNIFILKKYYKENNNKEKDKKIMFDKDKICGIIISGRKEKNDNEK